jgi:sulfite exporter TauE/SafE
MLSSIHPLGERGRSNRWGVTAVAYIVGSLIGGTSVGALVALPGWLAGWSAPLGVGVAVIVVAIVVDVAGITVPGSHRQVNERWLDTYRGAVYGFGYGWQLGAAVVTIMPTWLIPATLAVAALSGSLWTGLVVGVSFGLVRGASVLSVARVNDIEQLRAFHRSLHRYRSRVRFGALSVVTMAAAAAVLVV